ncbi:helix-turn-helix domain-containing protein [Paenibacillus allorhizosphaerae]|uniref:HTH-type transcriptional activator RhaS n=1 Tax=Paenibacillus allorhizosphaerae TaxID=2849866 RepID=A0ABM8VH12_9BACL|nr:AraC family transcriptional regulator [Paenibacillus allorhizosphaerae]CAG7640223.1 HTH-type transcriptional activator RhaS [Paenibacillus allorhizosphaerae]
MDVKRFPLYEDSIGDHPYFLTGSQRFYIDVRNSIYSYLHHHNFAEISYFFEGSGVESIDGVSHRLQPGTVSVVLPHQMHIIKCDSGRKLRKYCCMFDTELLFGKCEDKWFSDMLFGIGTHTPSFVDFLGTEAAQMKLIFEQLLHEYGETNRPGRLYMIRTKLTEALLLFIRHGLACRSSDTWDTRSTKEAPRLLWPLVKYVHSHYKENLSLKELSHRFDVSVPYISRVFKTYVGMGFVQYMHRLRIERATNMLLTTDMTITDIAFDVGFDNSRTFARVFRELKGKSAREYRMLAQQ